MLNQIKTLFQKKKQPKVAVRLVEEEKQRKTQLPYYPGLERYEILEKVGDGAFSNVYKALDTSTDKKVAIKVVRKHELDASEHGKSHLHPNMKKKTKATERANILKEVQIMRNIKHENIVQLTQFSESDDYYFLILELCEGGELFHQIVKLTYFSEDLARHVIVQVAEGIRYLHEECGVVHRDIKPENILFDPIPIVPSKNPVNTFDDEDKEDEGSFIPGVGGGGIGRVKIADFGLSKVIWDNSTLTPCGTVGYTAPEIVRDQKYSKSVDMWAIGCVLYTILCGFPPFYDESIRALTEKVARGQFTFLSPWWDPISDSAKDLIRNLLCVDPNERYTIEEFFQHPWVTNTPFPPKKPTSAPSGPKQRAEKVTDARTQAMHNAAHKAQRQNRAAYETPETAQAPPQPDREKATRRKDLFSPGVASIKEILDITYAVQRMGEEKSRKTPENRYKIDQDAGFIGGYDSISEDEGSEDNASPKEEHEQEVQHSRMAIAEQLAHQSRGLAPAAYKHNPQENKETPLMSTPMSRRRRNVFQLDLNKATLLKNRRVHEHEPSTTGV
ncbi:kinase-like domain-containing protein [Phycomyces nitens]|nr:kinase-like domain-containing protein [Phycomyces nitens]